MVEAKILIVEDDTDLREALKTALEAESYTVLEAKNGVEGYERALEHHPDLILLDILMPEMNGHEALERIRQDMWGKTVKVIFLTSFSDAENVVHAIERGSEDYIVKSHISLEDIVSKVKQALLGYTI